MSTWNYRVIETDTCGDVTRAIHEVYYTTDGILWSYSVEPASIVWDADGGDPAAILGRIQEALAKPILTHRDFEK